MPLWCTSSFFLASIPWRLGGEKNRRKRRAELKSPSLVPTCISRGGAYKGGFCNKRVDLRSSRKADTWSSIFHCAKHELLRIFPLSHVLLTQQSNPSTTEAIQNTSSNDSRPFCGSPLVSSLGTFPTCSLTQETSAQGCRETQRNFLLTHQR